MKDFILQFQHNSSIAYSILLFSAVIAFGIMLGKIKICGISIGATFVLFVGIFIGHIIGLLGVPLDITIVNFLKEFGLTLFVFTIGLQVGPSFFSSFKKGGMTMNIMALTLVLLNVLTVIAIYFISSGAFSIPILTGVMSGAVGNMPGLGSAQEALRMLGEHNLVSQIALSCAVTYPFGVFGVILSIILLRIIFKINIQQESEALSAVQSDSMTRPDPFSISLTNLSLADKTIEEARTIVGRQFVISRIKRGTEYISPHADTILQHNDLLKVVACLLDEEPIISLMGQRVDFDWEESEKVLVSRRINVTQQNINGKSLAKLNLHSMYGVNVTRVNRSGIDLMATSNLELQVGDRLMVVGELDDVKRVEKLLGNALKKLNEPPITTIFIGILLGVVFGSIPIALPGIPMPVKLGLAGGPLIIAILIGRFGYKFNLVTYTTQSANLMLREVGISLFLAGLGLAAGEKFVETVISRNGLIWMGLGVLVTMIPLMIVGIFSRKRLKMNFFTIIGMLSGASTNPPALSYAASISPNDEPAVACSTVYPLTMFLRILVAQLLILVFI